MEQAISPRKKLKSPAPGSVINPKTSVTCSNVPEGLFDATTAKKHFSKFGRMQRIRLFPKRQMCIIEYDSPSAAERAVLNAGAFDGFMFDVTRTKVRTRRKSVKKDDDPDWVPDSDVEEELSAMVGAPTYKLTRQQAKESQGDVNMPKVVQTPSKATPIKKKIPIVKKHPSMMQPSSGIESPVHMPSAQSSMSTAEAAAELHQLRFRVSLTPDEQWRTLEARDRILRGWGGAGSRVKVGGATIGTCQDMCPEKELLHRQAEHQVMTLETVVDSDGQLEPWRAVKQYSRSSADQEIPMCYELRPATVLARTCAYLLHEIADTKRQVSKADWFHFMWDRFRGIRKDVTQQALCCAESIKLVEMCARFHAHCAASLADLEHTQFDQKLNTDNLTKCLQTLKHMYADVGPESKPNEAEFRGYIALLNLGDANFWWEIKQLPRNIQKSEPLVFATQAFNAIDNNNYVRFFRLVQEKATYLQACILLRYFNDVRARALARMVKAYAPRGGSRFPAEDMMNALAFESVDSMKCFINHYGLRFSHSDSELAIILDRNHFIEDSDPFPISRAISLIESKRNCMVGEVIAGGQLPKPDYKNHVLFSSFTKDGKLKESALIAEEQGYNTANDSNKDIRSLKDEIKKLSQNRRIETITEQPTKVNLFIKPEAKTLSPGKSMNTFVAPAEVKTPPKLFSFKPAIPVADTDIIKNSPEKIFQNNAKNVFSFSKPQESAGSGLFTGKNTSNLFKPPEGRSLFEPKPETKSLFGNKDESKDSNNPFKTSQNVFRAPENKSSATNVFQQSEFKKPVFGHFDKPNRPAENIFARAKENIAFDQPDSTMESNKTNNIFGKPAAAQESDKDPKNIFKSVVKSSIFSNTDGSSTKKSLFASNGDVPNNKLSPGSLFKSALNPQNGTETKPYSIFPSKNKAPSVASNIFKSVQNEQSSVYDFKDGEEQDDQQQLDQRYNEDKIKEEERIMQEQLRRQEDERIEALRRLEEERRKEEERRREEERRKEDERRKEEERRKQEEQRQLEEKRRKEEERKQEELRRKIEEEKKAELKRKEEVERKFKERVDKESSEVTNELIDEINNETILVVLKEEKEKFDSLMSYAGVVTEEIMTELCNEMCHSEMKAEKFWTDKLMRKWFSIWRKQLKTNLKRRSLLEDTPVWLTERTPIEEATCLRRLVENAALKNMNAIHRGYKFTGESKPLSRPEPYNLMEVIKTPLLKRMKQINYPYDKCFFWKLTLVSPGATKWLYRRVEIEKWLLDAFSDKKEHASDSLLQVGKQSWNYLMDFAISVSLTSPDKKACCTEAVEGTNGLLFYATEKDFQFCSFSATVEITLKNKHPYQILPIAIIMPKLEYMSEYNILESLLSNLVKNKVISAFKTFVVDRQNISEGLNLATKSAMKWLAKKCPQNPPLEIDLLKSICQRYLGNEIWCQLKTERDGRVKMILRDLEKLIKCYNMAVEKLTHVITNEELFNYPSFPLEFKVYLDDKSPYPKPYEFIPSSARNSDNVSAIKNLMQRLKLPNPVSGFHPSSVCGMQQEIRKYCNQIGWFENSEEVVCKVVALLPNEFSDLAMPCDQFNKHFANFDLIDILNIIVYEKINRLDKFENRYAIYEKTALDEYRNTYWLHNIDVIANMKHKAIECEDDLDLLIEAKRRKIAMDSMEYLMLEDKDRTMVEENIKATDESISRYNSCSDAVKQLEQQIENEKKKSLELENLLKLALSDL
ncbi:hypothetical protein ABMA28_016786 [Loxostege sticticalis]|uniref:Protein xmas-2 n=2 Tax=Loxostege sticticalis TaxID=481309 RepID=A0ABD0T630_LOXSC